MKTKDEIEKEATWRFTDGHGVTDELSKGVFIRACNWIQEELKKLNRILVPNKTKDKILEGLEIKTLKTEYPVYGKEEVEYAMEEYAKIELPSDEEIEKEFPKQEMRFKNDDHTRHLNDINFGKRVAAKWMREQIINRNNAPRAR